MRFKLFLLLFFSCFTLLFNADVFSVKSRNSDVRKDCSYVEKIDKKAAGKGFKKDKLSNTFFDEIFKCTADLLDESEISSPVASAGLVGIPSSLSFLVLGCASPPAFTAVCSIALASSLFAKEVDSRRQCVDQESDFE